MPAFTPVGVDAQVRGMSKFTRNLGKMDKSIQKTGRNAQGIGKQFTGLGNKVLGVGAVMAKVAAGAVVGLGTAVVGLGVASAKAAVSYESAFAGVIKTTDGLVDKSGELTAAGEELRQGFRDLAKEVPVAVEELAGIGEIAGQLGVGKESLIDFTRTVADLGVATNMTTEEAAFNLARIANIFGVSTEEMGENSQRLGSTIVDLGNNFATTERDISAFAERIAGAGKIAGLTQADVLAIGTAMSSVGVQAEAGGTATQKVLIAINNAVQGATSGFVDNTSAIEDNENKLLDLNAQLVKLEAQTGVNGQALWDQYEAFRAAGGSAAEFGQQLGDTRRAQLFKTIRSIQDLNTETDLLRENQGKPITAEGLETFARTAGLTADEFKALWQEDASKAFELFVLGLGEQGDQAITTLEELGLTDQRLVRSFLSMAGAGDLLTEALASADIAWAENSALTEEAEKRYRTTESQLQLLKNQLRDVGITIGSALLPFINDLITRARPLIEELGKRLPDAIEAVISKIRELISAFKSGGVAGLAEALGFSDETIAIMQNIGQQVANVISFVMEHWEAFRGALIGIGAVLASAGIAAAIAGIVAAVAALLNPITLIIGAAALLGAAWTTNWMGIRDTVQPIITQLVEWLQVNIPIALQTATEFWQTTLLPVLQTVGAFITQTLIPIISQVVTWLAENLPVAGQQASSFFTETLIPAIQQLAEFFAPTIERLVVGFQGFLEALAPLGPKIQEFMPVLAQLAEIIGAGVIVAVKLLGETVALVLPHVGELFTNIVSTAIDVISGLVEFLSGAIQMIKGLFEGDMDEARAGAERVLGGLLEVFTSVFEGILGIVEPVIGVVADLLEKLGILQNVDLANIQLPEGLAHPFQGVNEAATGAIQKVDEFGSSLGRINLPPFLTPGSPTPFELGLIGIADTFSIVLPEAMLLFQEQATIIITQVRLLVEQLDQALINIHLITLPNLQMETRRTAQIMITAFTSVQPVLIQVNQLLEQMAQNMVTIAEKAKEAAEAFIKHWNDVVDQIEDKVIPALHELGKALEDIREAAAAASAEVDQVSGPKPDVPGFQHGANFIVPPGYPNDSFPMRVSSGERVIVIPPGEAGNTAVGGANNFNMTVNTLASPTSVIQQFEVMRALA